MPNRRGRGSRPSTAAGLLTAGALLLAGCGTTGLPGTTPSQPGRTPASSLPSSLGSGRPTTSSPLPSTSDTASSSPSDTVQPSDSGSPEVSPNPSDVQDPSASASATSGGSSPGASVTVSVTVRLDPCGWKVSVQPARPTEVVTVLSDGRTLTPGTREQTEFLTPTLASPDGAPVTEPSVVGRVSSLVAGAGKYRVLRARPDAPDVSANASRRPLSSKGKYVLYNASAPLLADAVVECNGQEQRWSFTAETSPTSGQVNCAVEPGKTSALAHLVFVDNCL